VLSGDRHRFFSVTADFNGFKSFVLDLQTAKDFGGFFRRPREWMLEVNLLGTAEPSGVEHECAVRYLKNEKENPRTQIPNIGIWATLTSTHSVSSVLCPLLISVNREGISRPNGGVLYTEAQSASCVLGGHRI